MPPSNKVWQDLDLQMLHGAGRVLTLGSEFMLTDNLGEPQDMAVKSRFVGVGYPFKISFYCVMICVRGELRVRFNLEDLILHAGDIMVGLPGNFGETRYLSDDCEVAIIVFTDTSFVSLQTESSMHLAYQRVFARRPVFHPTDDEFREVLAIYQSMRARLARPGFRYARQALRGYMQVLSADGFQWISQQAEQQATETPKEGRSDRAQQYFEAFLDLVREHYAQERDIRFYADKLCLTPKYLSTLVHKVSGRHAGEWIKEYVLLEAKTLLRSRQYTVQQVCDRLGFSNPSFFGKYFKASVGVSPGQYMAG